MLTEILHRKSRHIFCRINLFSKKLAVCEIMYENYGKSGQAVDGSTVGRMVCAWWIIKTANIF